MTAQSVCPNVSAVDLRSIQ